MLFTLLTEVTQTLTICLTQGRQPKNYKRKKDPDFSESFYFGGPPVSRTQHQRIMSPLL
jgi:hypothetical protein